MLQRETTDSSSSLPLRILRTPPWQQEDGEEEDSSQESEDFVLWKGTHRRQYLREARGGQQTERTEKVNKGKDQKRLDVLCSTQRYCYIQQNTNTGKAKFTKGSRKQKKVDDSEPHVQGDF